MFIKLSSPHQINEWKVNPFHLGKTPEFYTLTHMVIHTELSHTVNSISSPQKQRNLNNSLITSKSHV